MKIQKLAYHIPYTKMYQKYEIEYTLELDYKPKQISTKENNILSSVLRMASLKVFLSVIVGTYINNF